jgi:hypothetical protein
MRIRGETPKLGALCRWVRDIDVVSGLSAGADGISSTTNRSIRDKELLLALDAILRVTGPIDLSSHDSAKSHNPIVLQEIWNVHISASPTQQIYSSVLDATIFRSLSTDIKQRFKIIESTPGPLRKPPNHHPAILYASHDDAILLSSSPPETIVRRHPIVPNLSLILNVLSPAECTNIIAAAESIGFLPDAPLREGPDDDSSVLAHNFYWLIDESAAQKLWDRVRPHVPSQVGGKHARCLNRRFRVYRYVPGAEYRCHIGL